MNPKGIILTGGPNSVYEEGAATCSKELFELGIPVLGLCYGALAHEQCIRRRMSARLLFVSMERLK